MREQRKVVTVLFCDVVGSTALGESTDPEALRARMRRYFEDLRSIVERHGGTVEKFVGDAVKGWRSTGGASPVSCGTRAVLATR
jgi:class 3 adenylate cyclase